MTPRRCWFALICLAVINARLAEAASLPAGYFETLVAGGLQRPTAMTFAPDDRLFIAEQDVIGRAGNAADDRQIQAARLATKNRLRAADAGKIDFAGNQGGDCCRPAAN